MLKGAAAAGCGPGPGEDVVGDAGTIDEDTMSEDTGPGGVQGVLDAKIVEPSCTAGPSGNPTGIMLLLLALGFLIRARRSVAFLTTKI